MRALGLPVGGLNLVARTGAQPAAHAKLRHEQRDASRATDSAAGPEAPLSDEIVAQATALGNDYVRIYEFVRNNHRTEWYA
ncbi:hypothetical protein LP420_39905 [Massilia sp. B-10]|nr:hypothetical protein LP420_39905 [Massilia sp. B-10]